MNNAASSFTSCVATSRISTTTTSQTPKATFFWWNSFSTRSGSLTIMRAMAESVDSETLNATTWVLFALSTFTISSIAPTLFGRKTENCLTSGPSIFEVVSGKSTGIRVAVAQASCLWNGKSHSLEGCSTMHYLIVDLLIATQYWRQPRHVASALSYRFFMLKPPPVFIEIVHFVVAQAACL